MEPNKKKDLNEKLLDGQASFTSYSSKPKEKGTYSFNRCCSKMNNQTVLFIVCCLFACFATSEMIGALAARSLCLLGDASASCVDVVTYFSNLYAERLVSPKPPPSPHRSIEEGKYSILPTCSKITTNDTTDSNNTNLTTIDERTRLIHEVYVPAFSLFALIAVTIIIMSLAILEIRSGGDDKTNVTIMFGFATVNMVIDITCITMFYYRKDDILHNRMPSFSADSGQIIIPSGYNSQTGQATTSSGYNSQTGQATISSGYNSSSIPATIPSGSNQESIPATISSGVKNPSIQSTISSGNKTYFSNANINMFAAFTHIGSDTLRTIAIFLAATVSTITGINSSLCDAWAAILVSATIFVAIIPLSREVYAAFTGTR